MDLPKNHSVSAHKDIVGQTMHRWKHRDPKALHSGVGKKGKEGKVVTNPKQAIVVALSMAGKSNHSERLQSIGYSEETADAVAKMLDFADLNWQKQFESGASPGPEKADNHMGAGTKAKGFVPEIKEDAANKRVRKMNSDSEMLSPASYPQGPGNPMAGSSKDVQGLRMLG
jgi:hypothetical protein